MKDIKFDFKYGEKNFQESIKKTKRIDNGYSFEIRSERYYTNYEGRSSRGIVPIFDLNDEEKGRIIAIGWSGNWKAEFSRKDNICKHLSDLQHLHKLFYAYDVGIILKISFINKPPRYL